MANALDADAAELADRLRRREVHWADEGFFLRPEVIAAYQLLARERIEQPAARPDQGAGAGIVTIAGGPWYFANAWVLTRMLRRVGCSLPIQFWHFPGELDDAMRSLVEPWGVECVNVQAVLDECPTSVCPAGHWQMKAFAIAQAPFRHVLYTDADVVFVRDPSDLFDHPRFCETGVALWPDYRSFPHDHPAWSVFEVAYRDQPECQGGYLLYDKEVAWRPLDLALHYNEHCEFYYHHAWSDKDTYRLACYRLDHLFVMPAVYEHLPGTICHTDFDGRRLAQHRYGYKWRLHGENPRIDGFWWEMQCLELLEELRHLWHGEPFLPCDR